MDRRECVAELCSRIPNLLYRKLPSRYCNTNSYRSADHYTSYCNTNDDADRNTNSNPDCDENVDSDTNDHTNENSNPNSDPDAHPNSNSAPNFDS